jgi:hypothetical protein
MRAAQHVPPGREVADDQRRVRRRRQPHRDVTSLEVFSQVVECGKTNTQVKVMSASAGIAGSRR